MNPIKNSLKSLSVTTTNIIVALIFFIITAKISNPIFFGEVAIIQLLEVVVSAFFYIIPSQIIIREISYLYARKEINKKIIGKFFSFPFLVLPFFLIFLIFPDYIKLAIPYLFLYLLNGVMISIMMGMDMFTESAITGNLFLIIRWGIAIIAVLYHNIYLFIEIWTLGGILSVLMNYVFISKKVGLVLPNLDFAFIFKHFKEGLPIYLYSFSSFLSSQGDRVTTAYLLGSYYLGIYQFSALVAGVPLMILGALSNSLLSAASFYKSLGKEEKKMSSLTFKLFSILTFLVVIISIPIGEIVIIHFFPNYIEGLEAFILLLISTTLSFPISSFTNFVIAFKKNLKPLFILSILNGSLVLLTSYLLIPRIGIMGGAISQAIVSIISSIFILFYSIKTSIFSIGRKEIVLLSILPIIGIYEIIVHPIFLDLLLILIIIILFKMFGIITKEDIKIIESFLPKYLNFISKILIKLT